MSVQRAFETVSTEPDSHHPKLQNHSKYKLNSVSFVSGSGFSACTLFLVDPLLSYMFFLVHVKCFYVPSLCSAQLGDERVLVLPSTQSMHVKYACVVSFGVLLISIATLHCSQKLL